jgi:hypothetical protein
MYLMIFSVIFFYTFTFHTVHGEMIDCRHFTNVPVEIFGLLNLGADPSDREN